MIAVPVSVGELIDKLSILHIKLTKITNLEKLVYVNKEFEILYNFSSEYLNDSNIENLYHQLIEINNILWDVEDELRILESKKQFDEKFIDLARNVYITNDKRFSIKNQINELTNSEIKEQKDYINYQL